MFTTIDAERVTNLTRHAYEIRMGVLEQGEAQGEGYVGQALGIADVLAVAYCDALNYRPEEPEWEGRDRFLLSIGHYALALYSALAGGGVIPRAELLTYAADESRLPMSGMATYTPGMEISGGSLGHGLGQAVGMALALRYQGQSCGLMTMRALLAAEKLSKEHKVEMSVVHCATIKPFDEETVVREIDTPRLALTAENHTIVGGLFESVAAALVKRGIGKAVQAIGLPDEFIDAGALPTLHDRYGLSTDSVVSRVLSELG